MAKLVEFEVIRTSINDGTGVRKVPGDKVMLGRDMAEHYLNLGCLKVSLDQLYRDGEDEPATNPSAEAASADYENKPEAVKGAGANSKRGKPKSRATKAALDEAKGAGGS